MKRNKTIILGIFIIVALAQLAAPLSMIYEKEQVSIRGKEFKFKTQPIDPNDPFRGKYITLRFDQKDLYQSNPDDWEGIEYGYFLLVTDSNGFAEFETPLINQPQKGDYIKMKLKSNYYLNNDSIFRYQIPFNRFYMNENEALNAEHEYRRVNRDKREENAYALVKIFEGEAVLKDVIIGGKSAKDLM